MVQEVLPSDIFSDSRCRLPLPLADTLDSASRKTFEMLADPAGGSLAGLKGPGGIRLHSPVVSNGLRPVNQYLREPSIIDARTRELAILVTAREHNCEFEWAAHEAEAKKEGVSSEICEIIRHRRPTEGITDQDAALIDFGRELFGDHRVTSETYRRVARWFDQQTLVNIVNLMGMYAMTAALLIAFDAQLPVGRTPQLP